MRPVLATAALAAALVPLPADAALPMRFWLEYAGNGTVAFACHNVAAAAGTSPQVGHSTQVSCTFNGFSSAAVAGGGSHATSAGLANAALGSTVRVCVTASTVYGFPNMTFYGLTACRDVTVAPAGTVYL